MTAQERNVAWYRSLPSMRVTLRELEALPEYSASNPTGAIEGKRWRRHNGAHDFTFRKAGGVPFWVICQYEIRSDTPPNHVTTVTYRPVVTVKARTA